MTSAVQSIRRGTNASPNGTAKNRNSSGNQRIRGPRHAEGRQHHRTDQADQCEVADDLRRPQHPEQPGEAEQRNERRAPARRAASARRRVETARPTPARARSGITTKQCWKVSERRQISIIEAVVGQKMASTTRMQAATAPNAITGRWTPADDGRRLECRGSACMDTSQLDRAHGGRRRHRRQVADQRSRDCDPTNNRTAMRARASRPMLSRRLPAPARPAPSAQTPPATLRLRTRARASPLTPALAAVETTTGRAIAMASRTLFWIPRATRSGATTAAACCTYGRTSGTVPVTTTPGRRSQAP